MRLTVDRMRLAEQLDMFGETTVRTHPRRTRSGVTTVVEHRRRTPRARPGEIVNGRPVLHDGTLRDDPVSNPDAPWKVAALYVDPSGPYGAYAVDSYDVERDARTYEGPFPVVAHPPCGPWGKYKARCNQDPDAARHAVEAVRRFGGIFEHPIGSTLFAELGIPTAPWTPDRPTDEYGGYTIRIPQWHFGHRGEKDTILYIVGTDELPPLPFNEGDTDDQVKIERMGKRERRLTPGPMAWWMCNVASRCRPPGRPL